ncbi:hypothetical protein A0H76_1644 [Hepatospora eriocheir]|uniref:ISXO2-like transposase domain-containing protein n=1 Tax=Hepatospora eriocheir TaxID=1081669 RepID=A0A1X0QGP8_9MICR|nr:hypothetical protein A0H76_1644 [Hepatospora eriocheir]
MQIDESLFRYKQEYHRGRKPERKIWVFGLVDALFISDKISLHIILKMAASALLIIIKPVCLPECIIHSDKWCGYTRINNSNLGFSHFIVNHSKTFVNHHTGDHTQNIESVWNKYNYVLKIYKGIVALR